MNTNDRVLKVSRQYEDGMITLPELIEELVEIHYLSTLEGAAREHYRGVYDV